ncbi:hypothetical protein GF376_03130 [Candidatus Peregrinibacteria bacterium]|nr:hypothetical protein [Candidatus Peregrinibacteria bacterium]
MSKTYLHFGGDFKLTSRGDVAVLEINGSDSGTKGVEALYPKYESDKISNIKKYYSQKLRIVSELIEKNTIVNAQDVMINRGERLRVRVERQIDNINEQLELLNQMIEVLEAFCNINKKLANIKNSIEGEIIDRLGESDMQLVKEVLIRKLFGITGYAVDPELGLIVELNMGSNMLNVDGDAKIYLKEFLEKLYKNRIVCSRQIAINESDLGGYYFSENHISIPIDDSFRMKLNDPAINEITKNKLRQKKYISEKESVPYIVWEGNEEKLKHFVNTLKQSNSILINFRKYPYLVLKAFEGIGGDEVQIVNHDDRDQIYQFYEKYSENILIEGFVPPRSSEYDENIRFYTEGFVESRPGKKKQISLRYHPIIEAAYVRRSFYPIVGDATLNQKYVVNVNKGAEIKTANMSDQIKVKKVINRLINKIINDVLVLD